MADAIKFGAFIVTYHRSAILEATLRTILGQTRSPDLILIIDNSDDTRAASVVEIFRDSRVTYHAMGHNAGPAGAAYFGLEWFKKKGFDWVYWGDDDNPPVLPDTFERIFDMARALSMVGIAAAVGQNFNFRKGVVTRLKDEELSGVLDVDVMAGGGCMVVNLESVNDKTLPDPALFFGFEEMDFCFRVKAAGFRLVVDGDLMKRFRQKWGRLGQVQQSTRSIDSLWREYYSTRNLIYIFMYRFPYLKGLAYRRILTSIGKSIWGFARGWTYGWRLSQMEFMAIWDGMVRNMYKKF